MVSLFLLGAVGGEQRVLATHPGEQGALAFQVVAALDHEAAVGALAASGVHELEGLLDHFGGVADHVEQADGVWQFGTDRHQTRGLAGATGDLIEDCPVRQWPVTFAAFQTTGKQTPFQVLTANGLPATGGKFPFDLGRQAHKTQPALFRRGTSTAHRQQVLVVFHQPGAIHRREALGLESRQLHLGQTPGHALRRLGLQCLAGRRWLAAGQRLRLGHDLGVLAGGDFVFADEIEHRFERGLGVRLGHQRRDGLAPILGQILEGELAVDKVPTVTGNERLLITGLTLAEWIAEADLAVVQSALRQDVDVTEHHLPFARQRQADVIGQRLGVVQFVGAFIGQDQAGQAQRHGGAQ